MHNSIHSPRGDAGWQTDQKALIGSFNDHSENSS